MRKLAVILLCMFVTSWANAQDWYFGVDISTSHSTSENMSVADLLREYPGLNITVGDNFTRYGGMRLALGFNPQSGHAGLAQEQALPEVYSRYRFYTATGYLDGLVNLTEIFCEKDRFRTDGLYLIVGAGAIRTMLFDKKIDTPEWQEYYPTSSKNKFYPAARVGLLGTLRLTRSMDLGLEAKYSFVPDAYNGVERGASLVDGYVDINVGLRWFFSRRHKEHTEIPYLPLQLAEPEKKEPLQNGGIMRTGISFYYDYAQVPTQQKSNMERIVEFMNNYPEMRLVIHGYGDTDKLEDMDRNMKLAQERAENVLDQLVSRYGIAKYRLSAKAHTGTSLEKGSEKDLIRGVEFEMVIY